MSAEDEVAVQRAFYGHAETCRHGDPPTDCDACYAEAVGRVMRSVSLGEALDALEREDPAVADAAETLGEVERGPGPG